MLMAGQKKNYIKKSLKCILSQPNTILNPRGFCTRQEGKFRVWDFPAVGWEGSVLPHALTLGPFDFVYALMWLQRQERAARWSDYF